MQPPSTAQAVCKLAIAGEQAGFSLEQMIQISSGDSVQQTTAKPVPLVGSCSRAAFERADRLAPDPADSHRDKKGRCTFLQRVSANDRQRVPSDHLAKTTRVDNLTVCEIHSYLGWLPPSPLSGSLN